MAVTHSSLTLSALSSSTSFFNLSLFACTFLRFSHFPVSSVSLHLSVYQSSLSLCVFVLPIQPPFLQRCSLPTLLTFLWSVSVVGP